MRRKLYPRLKETDDTPSCFAELLYVLSNPESFHLKRIHQLRDGQVFVYDAHHVMASFKYCGGFRIYNLKLWTERHVDREPYKMLFLTEEFMELGSKVKERLDELLPKAKEINWRFPCPWEFFLLESCIFSEGTEVSVYNKTQASMTVSVVNEANGIYTSFKYNFNRNFIYKWVIEAEGLKFKRKTIKRLEIPKDRIKVFKQLLQLPVMESYEEIYQNDQDSEERDERSSIGSEQ